MRAIAALLRQLLGLVRGWWLADRIRISPVEGRLLRLEPPCLLLVAGERTLVLDREVMSGPGIARVIYSCRRGSEAGRLQVEVSGARRRPEVRWIEAGEERSLAEDDVKLLYEAHVPC